MPENTTKSETLVPGHASHVTRISNQENAEVNKNVPVNRLQLAERRHLELFRCDCCTFTSGYFKELSVDALTITDCYGCNISVRNVKGTIELINCEDVRVIILETVTCIVIDGSVNVCIRLFKSSFAKEHIAKMIKAKPVKFKSSGSSKKKSSKKPSKPSASPTFESKKPQKEAKEIKHTKEEEPQHTKEEPQHTTEAPKSVEEKKDTLDEVHIPIPTILSSNSAQFHVEIVDDVSEEGKSTVWRAKLVIAENRENHSTRYQCTKIDINNQQLFARNADELGFEVPAVTEVTEDIAPDHPSSLK
ncbi:hypothetical protein RFI_05300 [Reticulomyxa filosa]|uniref:C-CAP/cofactor C-like domain-containing protein n=1 Tax=Reticulomyxa filosa TaxID=46433 RepID=X6P0R8_RETFI|nr:hypothetical protein RFI_05300 [Reticulomyxa filosa]|eukprot:ETO31816.1 hypothetical protein RFI_05300 [Reticulomyxa filosa]